MRKIFLASMLAAAASVPLTAMADVHFEFGIPFQVTKKASLGSFTGYSTALLLDVDSGTALGIFGEEQNYSDRSAAVGVPATSSVFGFRIQKAVTDIVNVGMDLAEITTVSGTAANSGTGNLADFFGNVKLLSTKGKINSYLSAEMKYRTAKTSGAAANDFSGLQLALGAGLNF